MTGTREVMVRDLKRGDYLPVFGDTVQGVTETGHRGVYVVAFKLNEVRAPGDELVTIADDGVKRLILTADEFRPGDYVSEFDDTVKALRESRNAGVREVEFEHQPGIFNLFFMDWYHVARPVTEADLAAEAERERKAELRRRQAVAMRKAGPDDDEDDDGQQHDQVATWDEGDDRW
jgi:hypothetical protein